MTTAAHSGQRMSAINLSARTNVAVNASGAVAKERAKAGNTIVRGDLRRTVCGAELRRRGVHLHGLVVAHLARGAALDRRLDAAPSDQDAEPYQARQELMTEKAEFPESAVFVDRLLANVKKQ